MRFYLAALLLLPWTCCCQAAIADMGTGPSIPLPSVYRHTEKSHRYEWEEVLLTEREKGASSISNYPNFSDNPRLSKHMRCLMAPYLLPLDFPLKPVIDKIFSCSRAIENVRSLKRAGFTILFSQPRSFIVVAKHPEVREYLFKIYLDSKRVHKDGMAGWELLTTRCIVAQKIKKIIQEKKLKSFDVADKWLYPLPIRPKGRSSHREPVILVVRDMKIYNRTFTRRVWQKKATKGLLRELYAVLGRGYGSAFLPGNLPYTKNGKFAFIDTEYGKRKIPLHHVTRFLSKKMQRYWERLVRTQGGT